MRFGLLIAVGLICCAGCGTSDFVPVSGVVTLDGKPVEGASVIFHRLEGEGQSAFAGTDASGAFVLKTEDLPGAWIGNYEVAVRKVRTEGFPAIVEGFDVVDGLSGLITDQTNMKEIWDVPQHYGSFETSGLKIEITQGMPAVKLELKSK
jgi:hypothetical protein